MGILLVDDEIVQIESLKRGLKTKGFEVQEAASADEALERLKENPEGIELVITDYLMPGSNGIDLLKRIREEYGSLPVIIMTAYGEKEVVIEALRNRCDSFIEKPFTLDQLTPEIERARVNMLQNTSSRKLSKLLPRLVHQLNNPLMAIRASAELAMLQMEGNEELQERINGIIEATEKMGMINREILNLGQSTEEKMETVDIKVIIQDCLNMFNDLITLKGVSAETTLSSHPQNVLGNRFGLEQLFKNLILNALDSMDGRPEKRLRIGTDFDLASSTVSATIEDTGCGIPEKLRDRIYSPYLTGKQNGTGLGLSVVKSVVERHRGSIKVETEVDKGTTFTVTLPLKK
jgi:signal transduction histidine kinase